MVNRIQNVSTVFNQMESPKKDSRELIIRKSGHLESVTKQPKRDLERLPDCYLLKFPNILLRIFGLYHRKSDRIVFKIYACTICFINWFNFARMFSVYTISENLSADLVLKIIITFWLFICSFNSSIIFINEELEDRERNLLRNLHSIFELKICTIRQKRLEIIIYIIYAVVYSMAFINFTAIVLSYFGPRVLLDGFRLFLAPFHNEEWAVDSIPLKLLALFLTGTTSFHWCLQIGVYLSHTTILIEFLSEFKERFNDFVKESVIVSVNTVQTKHSIMTKDDENVFLDLKEKKCVCENKFEQYRMWHLKLCYIVRLLDKCYREFIGVTVLFNTISILLLLYIMSDWSGSCITGIMAVLYPFWTIASAIFLLVIVISASIVHSLVII